MVNDSSCCLENELVNMLSRTVQASLNLEHPSALMWNLSLWLLKMFGKDIKVPYTFFYLVMVQL